jgi:hypothetical protein
MWLTYRPYAFITLHVDFEGVQLGVRVSACIATAPPFAFGMHWLQNAVRVPAT